MGGRACIRDEKQEATEEQGKEKRWWTEKEGEEDEGEEEKSTATAGRFPPRPASLQPR